MIAKFLEQDSLDPTNTNTGLLRPSGAKPAINVTRKSHRSVNSVFRCLSNYSYLDSMAGEIFIDIILTENKLT